MHAAGQLMGPLIHKKSSPTYATAGRTRYQNRNRLRFAGSLRSDEN